MASTSTDPQQHRPLTSFKALSFDCYGTLIDWESGLVSSLSWLMDKLPPDHAYRTDRQQLLSAFNDSATRIEQTNPPFHPYSKLIALAAADMAKDAGVTMTAQEAETFGSAPGTWEPFPDTIDALRRLHRRYKLIILSNVDAPNIARTTKERLAPAAFDAVYTAEQVRAYKPSRAMFDYLFRQAREELGVDAAAGDLLHIARSLTADHVPATELGLPSAWIARGGDVPSGYGVGGDPEELRDRVAFGWKFQTLGEFADEVDRQFEAAEGKLGAGV